MLGSGHALSRAAVVLNSNAVVPVGTLKRALDFAGLYGRNDYLRHVQQIYRDLQDWLRQHQPELYASCHYTCIEISPSLAQRQQQRVAAAVVQQDGGSEAAWGPPSEEPCYIIMMEVLDNLAHDRVWRQRAGEPWQQTMVATSEGGGSSSIIGSGGFASPPPQQHQLLQGGQEVARMEQQQFFLGLEGRRCSVWRGQSFEEVLQPATDPLILRCLDAFEQQPASEASSGGGPAWTLPPLQRWLDALLVGDPEGEAVYLPTGCLQLLDTLHRVRPRHHLIAADFDALPEVIIPGQNAPLVATTVGGQTTDHRTYLVPKGTADIFFPTDFSLLARLYQEAAQRAKRGPQHSLDGPKAGAGSSSAAQQARRAQHMKTADFMRRFAAGEAAMAQTQSGYNPLLEDYTNTSVFLGEGSAAC
ncbi:hypothetical protein N2152v2_011308 [Parachlorella kessleri]